MKLIAIVAQLCTASAGLIAIRQNSALQKGSQTLVLKETGGIPGNECLTFRNNGEIVDAACVNEAADRQLNPSTISGTNVLAVQRGFSNGFRPDLVRAFRVQFMIWQSANPALSSGWNRCMRRLQWHNVPRTRLLGSKS